jgi:hypothetical protein
MKSSRPRLVGTGMIRTTLRRMVAWRVALVVACMLVVAGVTATASHAVTVYFQGFETDTAGWSDYHGGTITRVANGSTSTYANLVDAATGTHYARLGIDPDPAACASGAGTQSIFEAPYTDWGLGGGSSTFPANGFSTGVDVYLDVPYATTHLDTRLDWESSINDTTGNYKRGFDFNVGTDASGFVVTGGNNATRCGADPYSTDASHAPKVSITTSGWYTFKHTFSNVGGVLSVQMQVIDDSTNTVVGTWTRSDPSDTIGTGGTVGGPAYGWFVQNEFDGLAIDNSYLDRAQVCTPTGFYRDGINLTAAQIGGDVTGTLDATGCNIGVYNPTSVSGADIYGANYYGVVVNGMTTHVSNSTIHNIGEVPFNGAQHGNAVLYINGAHGIIETSTVTSYQKNGITVSGRAANGLDAGPTGPSKTSVSVLNNTVIGNGHINYIAQNGIQISYGATASVRGDTVSANWYTPSGVTACGVLLFQASGVTTKMNTLFDNETNLCNAGRGGGQFRPQDSSDDGWP